MFKVGDIVQIKEEKREIIRKTYTYGYCSGKKRELGIKAANGDLLIVTHVKNEYIYATDIEYKSERELHLESKYFELYEFVQEIDENTMFALL